jgi:predicted NUDIX family NTP pyrophosphohydrolase
MNTYPEVDRAVWMDFATARIKLLEAQRPLLDRLEASLG